MKPAWNALKANFDQIKDRHLREMFRDDPKRGETFTLDLPGIYLDYSKNRIDSLILTNLIRLAEESGLHEERQKMFSGEKINITENRAVLHVALRTPKGEKILVDGEDVVSGVH